MNIDREKFLAALLVASAAAGCKSELSFSASDDKSTAHADGGTHPATVPYVGPAKEGGGVAPAKEGGVVPPAREGVIPPAREGGTPVHPPIPRPGKR